MFTDDLVGQKQSFRDKNKLIIITGLIILCAILMDHFFKMRKWDDEFIIFRYAKNIADGNGWTFNPHMTINGCTTVLYTLLLSLLMKLGFPFPSTAYFVTLTFLVVCAVLTSYLLDRQGFPIAAWITPFLIVAHPILQHSNGMETSLYLTLAVLSLICYFQNRFMWTAILLALCVLTRPDAILLASILFLHYVLTQRKFPYLQLGIFILILLPWTIFSIMKFGSIFPNTLAAKSIQGEVDPEPFWSVSVYHWINSPMPIGWVVPDILHTICFSIVLFLLFVVFFRFLFGGENANLSNYNYTFVGIVLLWGILHSVSYIYLHIPSYYEWHMAPVVLLYCILGGIGLESLYIYLKIPFRMVPLLILFLLIWIPEIKTGYDYKINNSGAEIKNRGIFYCEAGKWFKNNTPVSSVIGCEEVGIIGYYSDRVIIDEVGLVTPKVAWHKRNGDNTWFIRYYHPDYLIQFYPVNLYAGIPLYTDWEQKSYSPMKDIIIPGNSSKLVIYKKINDEAIPSSNISPTPLAQAVFKGDIKTVNALLDSSTSDIDRKDMEGNTPLIVASLRNSTEIAKVLISKGADINIIADNSQNAILYAAVNGNIEIVKALLEHGADPNSKSTDGNTPLLHAAWAGNTEIIKLLLERKVDVNVKNSGHASALQLAEWNGHYDIVVLLKNAEAKK